MKKFFFFAAALVAATFTVQAERIEFTEVIAADAFGESKIFADGDFEVEAINNAAKFSVDANKAKFGTAESFWQAEYRLKTGGKSATSEGKELGLTLYIPSAGTVNICARTGSNSATDRSIILTQNGTEILNHILLESEAVDGPVSESGEATKVYPILSAEVEEGEVSLTFPVGSINIYAFEFIAEGATALDNTAVETKAVKTINENGELVIIKNGVTYNALGAVIE